MHAKQSYVQEDLYNTRHTVTNEDDEEEFAKIKQKRSVRINSEFNQRYSNQGFDNLEVVEDENDKKSTSTLVSHMHLEYKGLLHHDKSEQSIKNEKKKPDKKVSKVSKVSKFDDKKLSKIHEVQSEEQARSSEATQVRSGEIILVKKEKSGEKVPVKKEKSGEKISVKREKSGEKISVKKEKSGEKVPVKKQDSVKSHVPKEDKISKVKREHSKHSVAESKISRQESKKVVKSKEKATRSKEKVKKEHSRHDLPQKVVTNDDKHLKHAKGVHSSDSIKEEHEVESGNFRRMKSESVLQNDIEVPAKTEVPVKVDDAPKGPRRKRLPKSENFKDEHVKKSHSKKSLK